MQPLPAQDFLKPTLGSSRYDFYEPLKKGTSRQRINEHKIPIFDKCVNFSAALTARCIRRRPYPDSFIRTIIHSKRLALGMEEGPDLLLFPRSFSLWFFVLFCFYFCFCFVFPNQLYERDESHFLLDHSSDRQAVFQEIPLLPQPQFSHRSFLIQVGQSLCPGDVEVSSGVPPVPPLLCGNWFMGTVARR